MNADPPAFLDVKTCDGTPELTILQISDLHFGPPFVCEVADAALQLAHELSPDAIVVSGDLTQRARRDQFFAAKEYLSRLPQVPTLVIPGNHDVPLFRVAERLMDPHRLYKQIIDTELNPVLRLDSAVIVGLDSTAPRSAISNGRIHAWQLNHCEQVFADCAGERGKDCGSPPSLRPCAGLFARPNDAEVTTGDHAIRRTRR